MDDTKQEAIRRLEMALGAALAAVKPEAHLSWKAMFGGAGFYVDGVMFAAWYGNSLALKLPEDARASLLETDGALQAQSPQYIEVPLPFLDDTHLLEPWVERSVDYVQAQKKPGRSSRGFG